MSEIREQQYYGEARNANQQVWSGINELIRLQREWNALDYGTTLDIGVFAHEGLTKTELGSVIFDTADALVALLNTGHATNMAKLL